MSVDSSKEAGNRDTPPSKPDALPVTPDGVPTDLQQEDMWLVWEYEWKPDRGEWSKVPKDGSGGGYRINATDRSNGVDFDSAYETYANGSPDGVGIILDENDLLVGFDWDDCRDPEKPHGSVPDAVRESIAELDSYTEVSPSETGYRTLAYGMRPGDDTRADLPCDPVAGGETPHLEVYDGSGGRYLTITGQCVDDSTSTVEQRPQAIRSIYEEYIASDEDDENTPSNGPRSPSKPVDLSDRELLEKAKNAENGDRFERLWNGDTSGYPSHSEADQALCNHLAFWTGNDRRRIDSLFRDSGLMREKWDEDRGAKTYGERTIQTAIQATSDTYDPNASAGEPATTSPQENGVEPATGTTEWASVYQQYATASEAEDRKPARYEATELLSEDYDWNSSAPANRSPVSSCGVNETTVSVPSTARIVSRNVDFPLAVGPTRNSALW